MFYSHQRSGMPECVPMLRSYAEAKAYHDAVVPYSKRSRIALQGLRPLGTNRRYGRSLIRVNPMTENVQVTYYGTVIAEYHKSGEITVSSGHYDTVSTCQILNELTPMVFCRRRGKIYYAHGVDKFRNTENESNAENKGSAENTENPKFYRINVGLKLNPDLSPDASSIPREQHHVLNKGVFRSLVKSYREESRFLSYLEDIVRITGGEMSISAEDLYRTITMWLEPGNQEAEAELKRGRILARSGMWIMLTDLRGIRLYEEQPALRVKFFDAINKADSEFARTKDEDARALAYYDLAMYFLFCATFVTRWNSERATWTADLEHTRKNFRELLKYTFAPILFEKVTGGVGEIHHDDNRKYVFHSSKEGDTLTPRQNVANMFLKGENHD